MAQIITKTSRVGKGGFRPKPLTVLLQASTIVREDRVYACAEAKKKNKPHHRIFNDLPFHKYLYIYRSDVNYMM